MFFKSNIMKSSPWISNAFERLLSLLVTMYRSASFSETRIFFKITVAYYPKITTLHLSSLAYPSVSALEATQPWEKGVTFPSDAPVAELLLSMISPTKNPAGLGLQTVPPAEKNKPRLISFLCILRRQILLPWKR